MKNEKIIDSWGKIRPDWAADQRMLRAILASNRAEQTKKGGILAVKRPFNRRWLIPIAACLVLGLAIVPFLNRGGELDLKFSKGVKAAMWTAAGRGRPIRSDGFTEDELFARRFGP